MHLNCLARNNCSTKIFNIGDKVCVRSSLNIMYCRALIINKNGNEYNVFHLDYGCNELVDIEDIYELSKEFEKVIHKYIIIYKIILLY